MGIVFGKIDVEMPKHKVVFASDGYEVWKYPPSVAAVVEATRLSADNPPTGKEFSTQAFRALGGYIGVFQDAQNVKPNSDNDNESEKVAMTAPVVMTPDSEKVAMTAPVVMTPAPESQSEKIAMTAPVVMTPTPESEKIAMTAPVVMTPDPEDTGAPAVTAPQSMSFLLPSKYTTVAEAPVPTNPAVKIEMVPERYEAVLTFSGNLGVNMEAGKVRAEELLAKMKKDDIVPLAPYTVCGYNPPFSLPFLKRNEVHYLVAANDAKFTE